MGNLHNAASLLEFWKDPQNPLFQVRIFVTVFRRLGESIAVILSSGNTDNSAHLSYLVVMDFLVNVIKDIGYFCARKPRAFLGFRFPQTGKRVAFPSLGFHWAIYRIEFWLGPRSTYELLNSQCHILWPVGQLIRLVYTGWWCFVLILCRNEFVCKNSFLLRDDLFIIRSLKVVSENLLTSIMIKAFR